MISARKTRFKFFLVWSLFFAATICAYGCGICELYATSGETISGWRCTGFEFYYVYAWDLYPWGSGWTWTNNYGDEIHHESHEPYGLWTDASHMPLWVGFGLLEDVVGAYFATSWSGNPDSDHSLTRDPVNVQSGSVIDTAHDITLGHPALSICWERFYSSERSVSSGIGNGWRHSYDWRLSTVSNYGYRIKTPEGTSYGLAPCADTGRWETLCDVKWSMARLQDGFALSLTTNVVLSFSLDGRLVSYDDGLGGGLSFTYDADGGLSRVFHSSNHWLQIERSNGLVDAVHSPMESYWVEYSYDASSNLVCALVHDAGRIAVTTYAYDAFGMISRVNPVGETARYSYSNANDAFLRGKCTNSVFGTGWYEHSLTYHTNRTVVGATWEGDDMTGCYVIYTNVVQKKHTVVQYVGTDHEILQDLLYSDGKISDLYSGAGLCNRTIFSYDQSGWNSTPTSRRTFEVFSDGLMALREKLAWDYDAKFNLVEESYSYCPNGYVSTTASRKALWDTDFMVCTSQTDRAGWTYHVEISTNGLPLRHYAHVGDGTDLQTEFRYTNGWMLSSEISPRGGETHWMRNADGNPVGVSCPNGLSFAIEWETPGRLASVTRMGSAPVSTSFETDDAGRVRVVSRNDGSREAYAYDLLGRLTNVTERSGKRTVFKYAVGGKISEAQTLYRNGETDAVATVSFDYDVQANLRRIRNQSGECVVDLVLDEQERVIAVTNAEGQTASFCYDNGNRVVSERRFDGTTVSYAYNGMGNPSRISYPGLVVDLTTLANGALTRASCGTACVTYAWDGVGRMTAVSNGFGGVSYAYATNLAWTARKSELGIETKQSDIAGRLTNVIDEIGDVYTFSYSTDNALLAGVAFPNGLSSSYNYDSSDRITSVIWHSGTSVVEHLEYAYTNFCQVASVSRLDGSRIEYDYDALLRLSGERCVSVGGAVLRGDRYAHGLSGNRIWKAAGTGGRAGLVYSFGSGERLAGWETVGPVTVYGGSAAVTNGIYRHDAAGCITNMAFLTSDGTYMSLGLSWNGRYLLTGVSTNCVGVVAYSYGPDGRLLTRSGIGGTVGRIYDGEHILWEIDTASGMPLRSFTHGAGTDNWLGYSVYSSGATNRYTFVTDIFGSVLAVADEAGRVVERYEYDAWGRVLAVYDGCGNRHLTTQVNNTILWKGGEYEWSTGFYLFRARWYDPVAGRWLSKDPIGLTGGVNLYEYCGGDPVNVMDYSGCVTVDLIGGLMPMHSAAARTSYIGGSIDATIEYANSVSGLRGFESAMAYTYLGTLTSTYSAAAVLPLAKDAFLYEIGQKTLPDSIYALAKNMTPVERGRWLIDTYGLGRAILPQGRGWVLGVGKTFTTGPTPLGWAGAIGLGAWGLSGLYSSLQGDADGGSK